MASLIHVENQKLLWGIISKTDVFLKAFPPGHPQRETWFRSIIEKFYHQYQSYSLSAPELLQLNKQIIQHMLSLLKVNPLPVSRQPVMPVIEPTTTYSRNAPTANKQETYHIQFNERQKQYESMIERPTPPEVRFEELAKDEAISNMDELLKLHTQQREQELQNIMTASFSKPPNNNKNTITIRQDEPITIEPISLPDDTKTKKVVSWSENLETSEWMSRYEKDMAELKDRLLFLTKELSELKQSIRATDASSNLAENSKATHEN
jgi:hypothetical protein